MGRVFPPHGRKWLACHEMKHRIERVNELLKRELSDLVSREFHFEELVTIQEVDVTSDFKRAHVYVSVLGKDRKAAQKVLEKLESKRKELQFLLSRRVILKYTPLLIFKLDFAIERGTRVISLLDQLEIPEDAPPKPAPENPDKDHGDEVQ